MTYGYIRVSSDKQTVENQRFEISRFCTENNLSIDGWIEETISGTTPYNKRRLGKLLKHTKPGDIIICSEISRLGRSLFMIMDILNYCMQHECRLWTIKDHYRLGDNIEAKVLAFAFGLSAEIERKLISQRTKEALARKRAEGMHLGRPFGLQAIERLIPYKHHQRIRQMQAQGLSLNQIAHTLHMAPATLGRYLERCEAEGVD